MGEGLKKFMFDVECEMIDLYGKLGFGYIKVVDFIDEYFRELYVVMWKINWLEEQGDWLEILCCLKDVCVICDGKWLYFWLIFEGCIRCVYVVLYGVFVDVLKLLKIWLDNLVDGVWWFKGGKWKQGCVCLLLWMVECVEVWEKIGNVLVKVMVWMFDQCGVFFDFVEVFVEWLYFVFYFDVYYGFCCGELVGVEEKDFSFNCCRLYVL